MTDLISPRRKRQLSTVLTWILAAALLLSIISVGYLAVNPPETTDPFTEFYILGPDGKASNYPTNLSVNESGTVIVGISNHEHHNQTYTVVIQLQNTTIERTASVAESETWERRLSFVPETVGQQKIEILLYKGTDIRGAAKPYRRLRLWTNVSRPVTVANETAGE